MGEKKFVKPNYLEETRKIKKWIDRNGIGAILVINDSSSEQDKRIKRMIGTIGRKFVFAYDCCRDEAEVKRFLEKIETLYGIRPVDLEEIKSVIRPIEKLYEEDYQAKREAEYKSQKAKERKAKREIEDKQKQRQERAKRREEDLARKKGKPIYLVNAEKIKKWMEKNNTAIPPRASGNAREKKLSCALASIKTNVVNPFRKAKTKMEREEHLIRLRRFSNISEEQFYQILDIIEKIEHDNPESILQKSYGLFEWLKENKRLPRVRTGNEEEVYFRILRTIQDEIIPKIEKCQTPEEVEAVVSSGKYNLSKKDFLELVELSKKIVSILPEPKEKESEYLINIRKIKAWMEENNTNTPPNNQKADVSETERILGNAWNNIRYILVKPYFELETDEERQRFLSKFGGLTQEAFDEIIATVQDIKNKKKKTPHYLADARALYDWCKNSNSGRIPRISRKSYVPKDENNAGLKFYRIRRYVINPYDKCKTEADREAYFAMIESQFGLTKEQYAEIRRMYDELIKESTPYLVTRTREIKQWIDRTGIVNPSPESKDEETRKVGMFIRRIKSKYISKFNKIKTEQDRIEFFESIKSYSRLSEEDFFEIKSTIDEIIEKQRQISAQSVGKTSCTAIASECDSAEKIVDSLERKKTTKKSK